MWAELIIFLSLINMQFTLKCEDVNLILSYVAFMNSDGIFVREGIFQMNFVYKKHCYVRQENG